MMGGRDVQFDKGWHLSTASNPNEVIPPADRLEPGETAKVTVPDDVTAEVEDGKVVFRMGKKRPAQPSNPPSPPPPPPPSNGGNGGTGGENPPSPGKKNNKKRKSGGGGGGGNDRRRSNPPGGEGSSNGSKNGNGRKKVDNSNTPANPASRPQSAPSRQPTTCHLGNHGERDVVVFSNTYNLSTYDILMQFTYISV